MSDPRSSRRAKKAVNYEEPKPLSPRELRRPLRATGVEEKNIKALIATMDKDKNGSIDRDEFTAGFAHFLFGGVAGPINRRRSKP